MTLETQSGISVSVPSKAGVQNPINVLIVDDSATIRGLISRMLEAEAEISVVATSANGEQAIRELKRSSVDVIVLDIEMPVMDGLTAIPHLLDVDPRVKILIASTLSTRNAEISLQALQAGAADYLAKPSASRGLSGSTDGGREFRDELVRKIRYLGESNFGRRSARVRLSEKSIANASGHAKRTTAAPPVLRRASMAIPEILAIGSSTGGPQALLRLFKDLDPRFPLPIVVTQHMPPSFTAILAEHISKQTGRLCSEAKDGEPLLARRIYIAPGGAHMTIQRDSISAKLRLDSGPPENFCRPAVDPMFRSVAKCFGSRVLAAILTGMGSDGTKGGQTIIEAGGTVIAQDEETSVVWGMPGAAAMAGICSAILPLDQIASWISKTASRATP